MKPLEHSEKQLAGNAHDDVVLPPLRGLAKATSAAEMSSVLDIACSSHGLHLVVLLAFILPSDLHTEAVVVHDTAAGREAHI